MQRNNNLLKTKRILTPKYGPVFYIWLARGVIRPSAPRQLRHWLYRSKWCITTVFCYWWPDKIRHKRQQNDPLVIKGTFRYVKHIL